MFTPSCMLDGMEIENVKEDFRDAQRIEQYRVSKTALYIPDGMRWKYIPLKAISQMEESFRVISAGHCVPVREKRPELDLITEAGTVHISLEKQASMQKLLEILRKSREYKKEKRDSSYKRVRTAGAAACLQRSRGLPFSALMRMFYSLV